MRDLMDLIAKAQQPIMLIEAPHSTRAKRFVKKRKAEFQDRYGDNWQQVLYATANKLFGK
jgi:hypothetical protein